MKKYIVCILVLLFLPMFSKAAEVKLTKNTQVESLGQPTKVFLYFESSEGPINALSGNLLLTPGFFDKVRIVEENSVVGLWVKKPSLKDNKISFSAVMPGGVGEGSLFTLELTPKVLGNTEVFAESMKGFLNDGEGTILSMPNSKIELSVNEGAVSAKEEVKENLDQIPPKSFVIRTARDPKILNNQWFAVFLTTDLESGISKYEVAEVKGSQIKPEDWITQESPYVLKDQTRKSRLLVRAYDNSGNFTESVLESKTTHNSFSKYYFYVIILLIIVSSVLVYKRKQNVKKK